MSEKNFYKKIIVSVTGATLLSVGLSQVPNNVMSSVPTEVSAAQKAKVIGANSAVYNLVGKKMHKSNKVIKVGKKVRVYGQKTINGKRYYKIGKNQYIKAVNVDGKKRQAAKNTVLYTRSGKAIKNSKVRKGQSVQIYGGQVTINGKKYYSTKVGYIKVSALAKQSSAKKPSNGSEPVNSDNNPGTTTPANPNWADLIPATDPLKSQKVVANSAVNEAVEDATNAINGTTLSADEKNAAIDRISTIAETAHNTINSTQSGEKITDAQNAAVAACQLEQSKAESLALVPTAGDFVTKAGGDATKVSAAVDKAKEAIAKATTKDELNKAEADLQNDLNAVVSFAKQQEAAVDAINQAAKAGKDKNNNDTTMSDDEKATANATIDAVVESSLNDVKSAKTVSDLATAVNAVQAVCGQIKTDSETVTITK